MKEIDRTLDSIEKASRQEASNLLRGKVKILRKGALKNILESYLQDLKDSFEVEKLQELSAKANAELEKLRGEMTALESQNAELHQYSEERDKAFQEKETALREKQEDLAKKYRELAEQYAKLKEAFESDEHLARIESLEIDLASLREKYQHLLQSYEYLDLVEVPDYSGKKEMIHSLKTRVDQLLEKYPIEGTVQPGTPPAVLKGFKDKLFLWEHQLDQNARLSEILLGEIDQQDGQISHVVEMVRLSESNERLFEAVQLMEEALGLLVKS